MRTRALAVTLLGAAALLTAATPPPKPGMAGKPTVAAKQAAAANQAAASDMPPLVLLRERGEKTVAFRIGWRAGSVDDPPGKEGLTCLTARLLKEGGSKRQTYAEILRALYPMAAELGVSCGKEYTGLVARVHLDHWKPFVKILGEILTEPRLDPKAFARLRQSARDYVTKKLRYDDDEELGKAALADTLFVGHAYRHHVYGTAKGLAAITPADIKRQLTTVFTRARLHAGLAGGIHPALVQRIRGYLARLPAKGRKSAPLAKVRPIKGLTIRVVQKKTRASAISIGAPIAVARTHPDFPALALAASYFGEHRQSFGRLYRKMRGARGLNYGDYAYTEHFEQEGWGRLPEVGVPRRQQYFSIWIRPVKPSRAHFALRFALRELKLLLERGIPAADFERARKFLASYTRLWLQTTTRRLGYALDSRFYGGPPYPASLIQGLPALTPAKVLTAIRKHWTARDLKVAVVHPEATKLAAAIRRDAPSPITYANAKPASVQAEDQVVATFPLKPARVDVVPVTRLFER